MHSLAHLGIIFDERRLTQPMKAGYAVIGARHALCGYRMEHVAGDAHTPHWGD